MPITPLPTPPTRLDPVNFSARADAFLNALPKFATEANALEQTLALASTTGTSTTNTAVGTGTKILNTQGGKNWILGAWVYVVYTTTPSVYMVGQITAYNTSSGQLTLNVVTAAGSGSYASWTIGLAVPPQQASSLSGGSSGSIPYQSGVGTTSMLSPGVTGQVLTSQGTSAPVWSTIPNQPGRLIGVKVWSVAGSYTYTKTPGTISRIIRIIGGGGSGSGCVATTTGQTSSGGAGGMGAYIEVYSPTFDWDNAMITVGAGGAQTSAGSAGNSGGYSAIMKGGTQYYCPFGLGGNIGTASSTFPRVDCPPVLTPAPYSSFTNSDDVVLSTGVNYTTSVGSSHVLHLNSSLVLLPSTPCIPIMGVLPQQYSTTSGWGSASAKPGSGGCASCNIGANSAAIGVAGQPGMVIIYEYA